MAGGETDAGSVLVTGTTGFVGGHLIRALQAAGTEVRPLARGTFERIAAGKTEVAPLQGCGSVVHLAARAHVLEETSSSLLDVYRHTNRDATLKLAQAAAEARVPRFVFVSSIRVNGSSSSRPFRSDDPPHPDEPYAISKYEAELGLWQIAQQTGLEVVVIRPPLVYGPGVKANFRRLLRLAATGLPLPLASIEGWRSLIGVRNLCDLLRVCTRHESARDRTFLAADGEDISLPSLIRQLAAGMGRPARLFPVPARLVRGLAGLVGKAATFDKLAASLQIDATETFTTLGWRPPVPLAEGLRETARWFAETHGAKDHGDSRERGRV
jgi:nucleoside-diphosphate-sugar epimerase